MSVLSVLLVVVILIISGGTCFVFCNSIGRKKKMDPNWDPGVTEFDFGDNDNDWNPLPPAIRFTNRRKAKITPPTSSEALLLLNDDEELPSPNAPR